MVSHLERRVYKADTDPIVGNCVVCGLPVKKSEKSGVMLAGIRHKSHMLGF